MRSSSATDGLTRRVLLSAAGAVCLSGCLDGKPGAGTPTTSAPENDSLPDDERGSPQPTAATLTGDGSSTVYPITSQAAAVWNSNPPPNDRKSWGPKQYDVDTKQRVANYWAGLYGFSDPDTTQPPFLVNVGLSRSDVGCTKVMEESVDLGDASAPAADVLLDASTDEIDGLVDHVVGVDAQPVVVSREVMDAGVTRLTLDQLRRIYRGEVETWDEIPSYRGEDKEIQVVGRAEGSGTDAAFRANLFGSPDTEMAGIDVRKGQNQQVETLVKSADNAIAYLAMAFVDPDGEVPPVALEADDTVYEYGRNFDATGYPLSRDLHVYTYGGTSKMEAAFIRMLLHDYGQKMFVEANNYVSLSRYRQRMELGKLPDTVGASTTESPSPTPTPTETETAAAAETETAAETAQETAHGMAAKTTETTAKAKPDDGSTSS